MITTDAQKDWLKANPEYEFIGPPRPGVRFKEFGTLYADGIYIQSHPMKPIHLKPGCRGVGIREQAPDVQASDLAGRAARSAG